MTDKEEPQEEWRPFPRRWIDVAPCRDKHGFSIVTYNILNDAFVIDSPEYGVYLHGATEQLKFSAFRNRRVLTELELWDPDLVALQEVRDDLYRSQWLPQMAARGFNGLLSMPRVEAQGVALFFRHEVFELQQAVCAPLEDLVTACFGEPELQLLLHPRGAEYSALVARLRHKPSGRSLVVAAYHLTWDEFQAPVFKTLQAAAVARHADRMAREAPGPPCPLLLLGDLNASPGHLPYEMLARDAWPTGVLEGAEVRGRGEAVIEYVKASCRLPEGLRLRSCYEEATGREPLMTCLTNERGVFQGDCLDYIWRSEGRGLSLCAVMEECSEADMRECSALPSPKFPSDHVPVMARLRFAA